jgi:hypothetical protein
VSFESPTATGCRVYGSKGVHFALERSFERVCDALLDAFQPLALLCLPICNNYACFSAFSCKCGWDDGLSAKQQSSYPFHSVTLIRACSRLRVGEIVTILMDVPAKLVKRSPLLCHSSPQGRQVGCSTAAKASTLLLNAHLSVIALHCLTHSNHWRYCTYQFARATSVFCLFGSNAAGTTV